MIRTALAVLLLLGLAAASLLFSLLSGTVPVDLSVLAAILAGDSGGLPAQVVLDLRWPRSLAGFVTGALLAMAGALMQVLLRNPLADPYVLGVSGGAAVAVLAAMLAGLGGAWLHGAAFGGALSSMLLVFAIAHGSGSWTTHRLLLTGIVVAAGWGALISFILAISPAQGLRPMLFWLMGDLSAATLPVAATALALVGLLVSLLLARNLNLLARDALAAQALGVAVRPLRWTIYLLGSLMTAAAVTVAGTVGFIGLVVPHLLRLCGLRDYRLLLPLAAITGGSLLVFADTLARTLLAPQQLPVGVLTALVGVPVFLLLLFMSGRTRSA